MNKKIRLAILDALAPMKILEGFNGGSGTVHERFPKVGTSFNSKHNGFTGAFVKGVVARIQDVPRHHCPYPSMDTATVGGGRVVPTWNRAFALYWRAGYDSANDAWRLVPAEAIAAFKVAKA